jgi:uncharacterized protein
MKQPSTLSLEAVSDEPLPFAFELFFSTAGLDREPLLEISPVRLEGEISRIEKGFAIDARIAYGGRLECSRCLASYPFQTREDFSLILTRRAAAARRRPSASPPSPERRSGFGGGAGASVTGEEICLEGEDLDEYFYDEPVISVAPIAEERIQMAVPMKPLCREDCRGLCPRCGEDWNVADCGCALESADPRWEVLRNLKKV